MEIKKGQLVFVKHERKGNFYAKAIKDFNTEEEEFYPIVSAEQRNIGGLNTEWVTGEKIPCRNSLCSIEIIKGGVK